ncbi:hypothetical protein K4F_24380 [Enterococcus hirae]|jgi:hypothetical protein|nr:hypothetical protein K4F_24380 [Enterococcus hirae]
MFIRNNKNFVYLIFPFREFEQGKRVSVLVREEDRKFEKQAFANDNNLFVVVPKLSLSINRFC